MRTLLSALLTAAAPALVAVAVGRFGGRRAERRPLTVNADAAPKGARRAEIRRGVRARKFRVVSLNRGRESC